MPMPRQRWVHAHQMLGLQTDMCGAEHDTAGTVQARACQARGAVDIIQSHEGLAFVVRQQPAFDSLASCLAPVLVRISKLMQRLDVHQASNDGVCPAGEVGRGT